MRTADPVTWARNEAGRLRMLSRQPGASWGQLAAAMDFIRKQVGLSSGFFAEADRASKLMPPQALEAIADVLDGWVDYQQAGMASVGSFESLARIEASNDLMEQVQRLLDDGGVHVAAPVVLAGASLEEFLRSMVTTNGLPIPNKPAITKYAEALRSADVISAQDVKEVTAWAGQRNDAAHGNFGALSMDRARLLVDGINLFMQQHRPASAVPAP